MIRPNLHDYSDAYILVKGTITVPNMAAAGVVVNNTNKKVIFKNCAPFTNVITKVNNSQINAYYNNIVMPMYNIKDYSDAYSKSSGSLWQYWREEPALDANNNIIDFPVGSNNITLSKFKQQITG